MAASTCSWLLTMLCNAERQVARAIRWVSDKFLQHDRLHAQPARRTSSTISPSPLARLRVMVVGAQQYPQRLAPATAGILAAQRRCHARWLPAW